MWFSCFPGKMFFEASKNFNNIKNHSTETIQKEKNQYNHVTLILHKSKYSSYIEKFSLKKRYIGLFTFYLVLGNATDNNTIFLI